MAPDREPPVLITEADDTEMVALIASWRYAGPPTPWEAIVGHERQVQRCRELLAKLERPPEQLARLRIRLGAGLLILGPAGVGKSLLARALATAAGRTVIVPPVAELTPVILHRLYAQLAKMAPSVVILDEAEGIIGRSWLRSGEDDLFRAFLAALDGVNRPEHGPLTLALTTESTDHLEPAALRPGRLAPHLILSLPTREERGALLEQAIAGLPTQGTIEIGQIVDQTGDWSGAELATAVEEACARSLVDHTDALRMDLLLQVVGEHYTIRDARIPTPDELETAALHEAGHAVYAELTWPGSVESIVLDETGGDTQIAEELATANQTAERHRQLAGLGYAGEAAERLVRGRTQAMVGGHADRSRATTHLLQALAIGSLLDLDVLERGESSDRGSERMRADLYATVLREGQAVQAEVEVLLAPHRAGLEAVAAAVLAAPGHELSGERLRSALAEALGLAGVAP